MKSKKNILLSVLLLFSISLKAQNLQIGRIINRADSIVIYSTDSIKFTSYNNNGYDYIDFSVIRNDSLIFNVKDSITVAIAKLPIKNYKKWSSNEIAWLIGIILIDLLIYFFVKFVYKKKDVKRELLKNKDIKSSFVANKNDICSSIVAFGEFKILDVRGNNIVHKFSPILKELFLLLLCNCKSGIKSEVLKDILWYDKDDKNARNNRNVYITKLRNILSEVGDINIYQESGSWYMNLKEVKFDVFDALRIVENNNFTKDEAEKLFNVISNGKLLHYETYPWLDKYKSQIEDIVINYVTKYLEGLNIKDEPWLVVKLSDILFVFDSLDEMALSFKCKALKEMSKILVAKQVYQSFAKEYKNAYGEDYSKSYSSIIND